MQDDSDLYHAVALACHEETGSENPNRTHVHTIRWVVFEAGRSFESFANTNGLFDEDATEIVDTLPTVGIEWPSSGCGVSISFTRETEACTLISRALRFR